MMTLANYWWWLSAGTVLMVLEIITPGIFFMWIGIGAFITGLIAMLVPSATPVFLGFVFAVLSVISVFAGRKLMLRKPQKDTGLNNRMAQYVGQTYLVCEPIIGGRGKIAIGDTQWLAAAEQDIPAKTVVRVTGIRGTTLEVKPINGR